MLDGTRAINVKLHFHERIFGILGLVTPHCPFFSGYKGKEQQHEPKDDEKKVDKKLAVMDRVAAEVRKLDRIKIPEPKLPAKIERSKVRCFSFFSSESPSKGMNFSLTRYRRCLLDPKFCAEH